MTLRTGNKGFTLIELIIVLLLIGMASSVVIVSLSGEYRKSVLKYEVRKICTALRYSREVSVTKHMDVSFIPDEDGTGYSVSAGEKSFFSRKFPRGITIESEVIVFSPLGDSTGGTITVEDENGRKYEISVSNITGKAKVGGVQSS